MSGKARTTIAGSSGISMVSALLVAILVLAVGFGAGYLVGQGLF